MPESKAHKKKPSWIRSRPPGGERYTFVKNRLKTLDLHTVCEEARCPNVAECWGMGTATVMILGDTCTRGCRFCAVKTGNPKGVLDENEPRHVAEAVADLKLDYVVLTSVDRDDLADGGSAHFAETVREIKTRSPGMRVEVLIPDFGAKPELLEILLASKPDVVAHNVETVRRLTPSVRDLRASYDTSLDVLARLKALEPACVTKSSIMLGLGETEADVLAAMTDLREAGVDILTLGQYLQPSPRHLDVERYYTPEEFEELDARARDLGFRFVASGPMVRSSYRAAELFVKGLLESCENRNTGDGTSR